MKIKELLAIFSIFLFFEVSIYGQACTTGASPSTTTSSTDMDNSTHNNCVDGDVAAWTVDKVYLYTDVYCTEGKQEININDVSTNSEIEAAKEDFSSSPNLGSASISNGTYNCVATRMWDNVTSSPKENTTSGSCLAADNYTQDICGSGANYVDADNNSTVACSDNNNWIWVYFSTSSTDASSDSASSDFMPPTSDNLTKGVTLGAALVVSGTKVGSFKTDLTNRMADFKCVNGGGDCSAGSTECSMMKPAFSFE